MKEFYLAHSSGDSGFGTSISSAVERTLWQMAGADIRGRNHITKQEVRETGGSHGVFQVHPLSEPKDTHWVPPLKDTTSQYCYTKDQTPSTWTLRTNSNHIAKS